MPIYEYHCKTCDNHFEKIQKIDDHSPQICPSCQGKEVERLVSAAGFQLKGSGWYVTDFKNPKKNDTTCAKPECSSTSTCATNKQDKKE
jgi:putative FmdB family regulatory protein